MQEELTMTQQWDKDVVDGVAREHANGDVEYKCSACDRWVDSFVIAVDEPLTCEKCDRGY